MRFEVVDVGAAQTCPSQRSADKALLGPTVGNREATGGAVLVHGAAADDRADAVTVASGIAQSLENQDPAALAAGVAVGCRVEGLAPPVRGQHPGAGGRDGGRGAQQHVDPTGQGQIAVTGVQGLTGLMDGHQGGTACGVHRDRRTFQAEGERDPARDGIERVAGDEMRLEALDRVPGQQQRVFVGRHPDEDAGSATAQRRRPVARPLQSLPGDFEHQSLLRIDPDGFAGGDAEELRIEGVDAVEVSAATGVDLARGLLIGVVEFVDVEAVLGDLPDRVHPAGQHLPVGVRIGRAREAAGHRDDGDGLVGRRGRQRHRLGGGSAGRPIVEGEHVGEQVVRHVGQSRVVHGQGGRQFLADRLFESASQFDGHQRIHAEVEEPGLLADLGRLNPGHLRDGVTDVVQDQFAALCCGGRGEFLDQSGAPCCPRRCRDGFGHLTGHLRQQRPSADLLVDRQEAGPVHPRDHRLWRPG